MLTAIETNEGVFINRGGIIIWSPEDGSGIVFTLGAYKHGRFSVPLLQGMDPRNPITLKLWKRVESMGFKMFPPPENNTWTVKECRDNTGKTDVYATEDPVVVGTPEFPALSRFQQSAPNFGNGFGDMHDAMREAMRQAAANRGSFTFTHTF